MTKLEAERQHHMFTALESIGISYDDAQSLRRVSMTLQRWHELECGVNEGCVERDETTGRTYWHSSASDRRYPTPDRETGALKRLQAIMNRYAPLRVYVQGDPRGCALYILRPQDVPYGASDNAYYPRGIAVY